VFECGHRKLADKVAAAGYFVVVPDYFHGDPFVLGSAENPLAGIQDWLKSHGTVRIFGCLYFICNL
jgi:dienelactone hydrolase